MAIEPREDYNQTSRLRLSSLLDCDEVKFHRDELENFPTRLRRENVRYPVTISPNSIRKKPQRKLHLKLFEWLLWAFCIIGVVLVSGWLDSFSFG